MDHTAKVSVPQPNSNDKPVQNRISTYKGATNLLPRSGRLMCLYHYGDTPPEERETIRQYLCQTLVDEKGQYLTDAWFSFDQPGAEPVAPIPTSKGPKNEALLPHPPNFEAYGRHFTQEIDDNVLLQVAHAIAPDNPPFACRVINTNNLMEAQLNISYPEGLHGAITIVTLDPGFTLLVYNKVIPDRKEANASCHQLGVGAYRYAERAPDQRGTFKQAPPRLQLVYLEGAYTDHYYPVPSADESHRNICLVFYHLCGRMADPLIQAHVLEYPLLERAKPGAAAAPEAMEIVDEVPPSLAKTLQRLDGFVVEDYDEDFEDEESDSSETEEESEPEEKPKKKKKRKQSRSSDEETEADEPKARNRKKSEDKKPPSKKKKKKVAEEVEKKPAKETKKADKSKKEEKPKAKKTDDEQKKNPKKSTKSKSKAEPDKKKEEPKKKEEESKKKEDEPKKKEAESKKKEDKAKEEKLHPLFAPSNPKTVTFSVNQQKPTAPKPPSDLYLKPVDPNHLVPRENLVRKMVVLNQAWFEKASEKERETQRRTFQTALSELQLTKEPYAQTINGKEFSMFDHVNREAIEVTQVGVYPPVAKSLGAQGIQFLYLSSSRPADWDRLQTLIKDLAGVVTVKEL